MSQFCSSYQANLLQTSNRKVWVSILMTLKSLYSDWQARSKGLQETRRGTRNKNGKEGERGLEHYKSSPKNSSSSHGCLGSI